MTDDEVQMAIANANPALVFAIERDHLASQTKDVQRRLFGLHGVIRCFRDAVTNDNPDVTDGLVTVLSELENLADTTETIADRIEKLANH
jgi:hypothetical protein